MAASGHRTQQLEFDELTFAVAVAMYGPLIVMGIVRAFYPFLLNQTIIQPAMVIGYVLTPIAATWLNNRRNHQSSSFNLIMNQLGVRSFNVARTVPRMCAMIMFYLMLCFFYVSLVHMSVITRTISAVELPAPETTFWSVFVSSVAWPVATEILYRGFYYQGLCQLGSPIIAAIVSTLFLIIFTLNMGVSGALGLMLCSLYHDTGSIVPCVLVHSFIHSGLPLVLGAFDSFA